MALTRRSLLNLIPAAFLPWKRLTADVKHRTIFTNSPVLAKIRQLGMTTAVQESWSGRVSFGFSLGTYTRLDHDGLHLLTDIFMERSSYIIGQRVHGHGHTIHMAGGRLEGCYISDCQIQICAGDWQQN